MVVLSIYEEEDVWSGRNPPNNSINPYNYGCPRCGLDGEFILERADIADYGFSKAEAPHGICISCAEITSEDYGSWSDEKDYSYDKNGRILASILVFLDRTEEELENAIYRTKNNSFAEQKKYRMKKKSTYRSALGEDRYQNLSPPYFIGSKAGWTTGIVSKEREELATFVDFRNDWFDNLLPSFMPLELKLDQSSKMKTDVPTRLVYAIVCTYLHKTAEMKHTETISSFLKRMNVGQKDLEVGIKKWPCPVEKPIITHINSIGWHVPSISTIDSLLSIIENSIIDVKLSSEEFDAIKRESHITLKKLHQIKIKDKPVIDVISPYLKYRDLTICDLSLPVVGLIETLCVRYAAYKVLEKRKARVLERKFLMPGDSSGILSKSALNVIDMFQKIVES